MIGLITEGLSSSSQRTLITAGLRSAFYDRIFFCAPLVSITLLSYPCSSSVILAGVDVIAEMLLSKDFGKTILAPDPVGDAKVLKNPKTSVKGCC